MTQPTYSYTTPPNVAPLPKRKAGSRFTSGHILMIVAGLLAFLLSLIILSKGGSQTIVYVAKTNIIEGQRLDISQFEPKSIPSSSLDSIYVSKDELTQGRKYYAARSIEQGEPLLDVARTPQAEKSGARLISIPIDKTKAVNGALSRGDRIDVIQTPDDSCAFRALSNLEVISAPSSGGGGGALGTGSNSNVITVAVTNSSDDLTLAGVIATGKFQVIKTTGAKNSNFVVDPVCGNPEAVSSSDSSGAGNG